MSTAVAVALLTAVLPPPEAEAADLGVRIESPHADAVVTRDVPIVAAGAPIDVVVIEVSVDRGATWGQLATSYVDGRWRARWRSGTYSGRAALRARSTLSDKRHTVSVRVDNTAPRVAVAARPQVFSPNGDGRAETTLITVRASERATVGISIRNPSGRVVRHWSGLPTVDGRATVRWAGRVGDRRVGDGVFGIRALARDAAGNAGRAATTTRVDKRRPVLRLTGLPNTVDASRPIEARYWVGDASRSLRITAILYDGLGAVRQRSVVRPRGGGVLALHTRYRNGDRLLPGDYRVALRAIDPAGNASRVSRRFTVHRAMKARVYTRLEGTGRKVALTFDDCHYGDSWTSILNTLRAARVKATFFCPGDLVQTFPAQARRVVDEGHSAAAHAWGHPLLTRLSFSDVVARLSRDRAAWKSVGATSPPYFRPPYGAYNSSVVAAAGATGHGRVMMWDIDSRDTAGASGSALVCNVVCRARSGSVILLHTKPVTADALPAILRGLRRRGLTPVTLPQLFRAAGHH